MWKVHFRRHNKFALIIYVLCMYVYVLDKWGKVYKM